MDTFLDELIKRINDLNQDKPLIIGIDGRCAAGKSTLAANLQKEIGCSVFHMDDYFLQQKQRTADRLNTPGGNVDYERFYSEILFPLKNGEDNIIYRPYNCRSRMLSEPVLTKAAKINVAEGSYSCHPMLWDSYDLHVFLTVKPDEQMKRIIKRNGEDMAQVFGERWIPLEEKYFSSCNTEERCEMWFDTSDYADVNTLQGSKYSLYSNVVSCTIS